MGNNSVQGRRPRVAIVGAGLGGLAAAQAMRASCDVVVIEQAPQLGEIGAGINMSPNAVKVLQDLGFEDRVRKVAFQPRYHVFRDWKSARALFRVDILNEY